MEFEAVRAVVDGVPNMTAEQGRTLYDLVRRTGAKQGMELGFAHGTGSCYMGAALQENGGKLIAIDNQTARDRRPSIGEQLEKTGLAEVVEPVFAARSYTWELMKLIEAHTTDGVCEPFLDICYIDGAHQWEPDGMAFFLVDKLLKVGGWLLFDDIHWKYAESTVRDEDWVRVMPREEQETAQVERVFRLLVEQHPHYGNCRVVDWWGWAQKIGEEAPPSNVLDEMGIRKTLRGQAKDALRPAVHALRRRRNR